MRRQGLPALRMWSLLVRAALARFWKKTRSRHACGPGRASHLDLFSLLVPASFLRMRGSAPRCVIDLACFYCFFCFSRWGSKASRGDVLVGVRSGFSRNTARHLGRSIVSHGALLRQGQMSLPEVNTIAALNPDGQPEDLGRNRRR